MPGAQLTPRLLQSLASLLARPIGFDGALQFPLGPNTGKPQIMNRSHGNPVIRQNLFKCQLF
ncbi:uncharacterized protein AruCF_1091 [Achromobacter ruhlandii]|nr:uncharacterized protein AruCF_1091 [Achromobacter ruhlandii]